MKVVILAAGEGTRLRPLTFNTPKSLLEIKNGTCILDMQINALKSVGVKDVVIVIGYMRNQIEDKVKKYKDMNITTVFNPFYKISNNLMSLWMARQFLMNDDFFILNGDNIVKETVFKRLLNHKTEDLCMVINRKAKYDWDDMKVYEENGKIKFVSKKLEADKANAESIGLVKVTKEAGTVFFDILNDMLNNHDTLNLFWLAGIQETINRFDNVEYIETESNEWFEMDFKNDYDTIKSIIKISFDKFVGTY